jgi:hypothetical protein
MYHSQQVGAQLDDVMWQQNSMDESHTNDVLEMYPRVFQYSYKPTLLYLLVTPILSPSKESTTPPSQLNTLATRMKPMEITPDIRCDITAGYSRLEDHILSPINTLTSIHQVQDVSLSKLFWAFEWISPWLLVLEMFQSLQTNTVTKWRINSSTSSI